MCIILFNDFISNSWLRHNNLFSQHCYLTLRSYPIFYLYILYDASKFLKKPNIFIHTYLWLSPKIIVLYVLSLKLKLSIIFKILMQYNSIPFWKYKYTCLLPASQVGKTVLSDCSLLQCTAIPSNGWHWRARAPFCPSASHLHYFFLSQNVCIIWSGQKSDRTEERKTITE